MFPFLYTVDGTPCYLWDYDGWKVIPGNEGLDEPKYTLAHTLGAVNPNARIIVILRGYMTTGDHWGLLHKVG